MFEPSEKCSTKGNSLPIYWAGVHNAKAHSRPERSWCIFYHFPGQGQHKESHLYNCRSGCFFSPLPECLQLLFEETSTTTDIQVHTEQEQFQTWLISFIKFSVMAILLKSASV